MKPSFEQNSGTYRQVGDFKIPNLTLHPKKHLSNSANGVCYIKIIFSNTRKLFLRTIFEDSFVNPKSASRRIFTVAFSFPNNGANLCKTVKICV